MDIFPIVRLLVIGGLILHNGHTQCLNDTFIAFIEIVLHASDISLSVVETDSQAKIMENFEKVGQGRSGDQVLVLQNTPASVLLEPDQILLEVDLDFLSLSNPVRQHLVQLVLFGIQLDQRILGTHFAVAAFFHDVFEIITLHSKGREIHVAMRSGHEMNPVLNENRRVSELVVDAEDQLGAISGEFLLINELFEVGFFGHFLVRFFLGLKEDQVVIGLEIVFILMGFVIELGSLFDLGLRGHPGAFDVVLETVGHFFGFQHLLEVLEFQEQAIGEIEEVSGEEEERNEVLDRMVAFDHFVKDDIDHLACEPFRELVFLDGADECLRGHPVTEMHFEL